MRWGLGIAILLIFVIGCAKPILLDNSTNDSLSPRVITTETGRPEIPRTTMPQDTPDDAQTKYQNPGEQPHGQSPIIVTPKTPSVDLDVPLGDPLGKHHPLITRAQFPLLQHQPVRVTGNLLVGYEERIRFDFGQNSTGRIAFTKDETDESIGSFLRFEEDQPILEYSARLDRGTFYDLQGRDIQILGHTYVIAEVTNNTVALFGKDVPSNLLFEQGKPLVVNTSRRSNTRSFATPNTIGFVLYAEGPDEGDILLSPGESLSENIRRELLASKIFDLRYKGAPMQNATVIRFDTTKFGYKLTVDTFAGMRDIPLVEQDAGRALLGRKGDRLHVASCAASRYCIGQDDLFLLTSSDGKTFLLRYTSVNAEGKVITLRDTLGNRYDYKFTGNPGSGAWTDITLNKISFRAAIGPKDNATGRYNISIQGLSRDIVTPEGHIVRIGDLNNNSLPIEIIIPPFRTNRYSETTRFNITYSAQQSSWVINAGNLSFVEDEDTEDTFALTGYGMAVLLDKNKRDIADNQGDEMVLLIPRSQMYGIVSLEG